jgi:hypothetical protein
MTATNQAGKAAPRAAPDEPLHWLQKPTTIRLLWVLGFGLLAITVLAQIWIPMHGHFGWDDWFGFYALFGFFSCVLMVVVAKALALWVKRPDTYYEQKPISRKQGKAA